MNDAVVTLVELICNLRDRLREAVAEIETLKKAQNTPPQEQVKETDSG